MDLLTSITTGSAASLSASLFLRPVWNRLAIRTVNNPDKPSWLVVTTRMEAMYLGAHAVAGASQGLLFWLSWGFAALSITSWWMHGLIVGVAYMVLLVLPLLAICSSVVRINKNLWWVLLCETLFTCIAVGLACSWNWMSGR